MEVAGFSLFKVAIQMAYSNAVVQIHKIIGILINFHPFYFKNLF